MNQFASERDAQSVFPTSRLPGAHCENVFGKVEQSPASTRAVLKGIQCFLYIRLSAHCGILHNAIVCPVWSGVKIAVVGFSESPLER
jgi:hypothetical protein